MNKKLIYSNKKSENLYDYYSQHDFNPVPIPINTELEFKKHILKRINLFENHLKIPRKLFNNSNVLEFGCNSGENALVNALLGSKLYLCEPNVKVHQELKNNFKSFKLNQQINNLNKKTIESFKSKKKFDFVIAEGFLSTISNREKNLIKLSNFLNKNSFLVINHDDIHGCFIENIKKLILKNICEKNNYNLHSKNSFNFCKKLFGKEYSKLNTKRPIITWWKDALVSKYNSGKYNWDFSSIFKLLKSNNLNYWSSSPLLQDINSFQWYKNISKNNINSEVNENFKKNILFVSTGIIVNKSYDHKNLYKYIKIFHKKIDQYVFKNKKQDFKYIFKNITNILDQINDKKILELSKDLNNIALALNNSNYLQLINSYKNSRILKNLWGNTSLYLCFIKN